MSQAHPPDHFADLTRENEALVLAAEERGAGRVDALPMKITFEFTGDCNLHCFFCDCEFNRNEFRKQGVHKFSMTEELFRTMAEAAFPRATVVNPTVVGEPFTFPYFDLLIEYAERYGVMLELVTNGMLLKGSRMERLMPLLDRLIMSFDGGTKETFEHCRTGSDFDTVIGNLRRFRDLRRELGLERRIKFSFAVTLMKENIAELPRIVEWAQELGADAVGATHLLVFAKELRGSSLFEHKELANHWIAAARATAARIGMPLTAPAPFELDETTTPPEAHPAVGALAPKLEHRNASALREDSVFLAHESPPPSWAPERYWCRFAWREVYINFHGDVAPCCHQSRPVVGNVFRDDWDDIWNGVEYQLLRSGLHEKQPQPYCATCSLLAEQGLVDYSEDGYIFEDRYPEQRRADERPARRRN